MNGTNFTFESLKLLEKKCKDRKVKAAVKDLIDYLEEKCSEYISDNRYIEYCLSSGVTNEFFLNGIKRNLEDKLKTDITKKINYCKRLQNFEELIHFYFDKIQETEESFNDQFMRDKLSILSKENVENKQFEFNKMIANLGKLLIYKILVFLIGPSLKTFKEEMLWSQDSFQMYTRTKFALICLRIYPKLKKVISAAN